TLTLAEPQLEFASVAVGFNQAKAVTLNNADSPTQIEGIVLEKEEPTGQFAIQPPQVSSDCEEGNTVEAGNGCEVTIFFHPTSGGEKKATLVVESDATNNPVEVQLIGTAVAPELSIAPSPFDFGSVAVGSKSAGRELAAATAGPDPAEIETAALTGANPGQFQITSDGCSLTELGEGHDCSVTVAFAPTSAGPKSATLEVPSNA